MMTPIPEWSRLCVEALIPLPQITASSTWMHPDKPAIYLRFTALVILYNTINTNYNCRPNVTIRSFAQFTVTIRLNNKLFDNRTPYLGEGGLQRTTDNL